MIDPGQIKPYADRERRTCLQVARDEAAVQFIELNVTEGLEVKRLEAEAFDQRFTPLADYPAEKACQLYVSYSRTIGATPEALDFLGSLTNITKEEREVAEARKRRARAESEEGTVKPARAARAPRAPKAAKAPVERKPRGPSAAARFKELIMRGTLSDDKIFAKVQEEFGLDDSKRSYVAWYRNALKKAGEMVPEPK